MVVAPILTRSQSSSVLGDLSIVPFLSTMIATASKMLSAIGSIRSRISSFTDTIGVMSPHNCAVGGTAMFGGDEGVDFDEQVDMSRPETSRAIAMPRFFEY